MEKIKPDNLPETLLDIEGTPEDLRTIASRMEAAAKMALPNQKIQFRIANGIQISWTRPKTQSFIEGSWKESKDDAVELTQEELSTEMSH